MDTSYLKSSILMLGSGFFLGCSTGVIESGVVNSRSKADMQVNKAPEDQGADAVGEFEEQVSANATIDSQETSGTDDLDNQIIEETGAMPALVTGVFGNCNMVSSAEKSLDLEEAVLYICPIPTDSDAQTYLDSLVANCADGSLYNPSKWVVAAESFDSVTVEVLKDSCLAPEFFPVLRQLRVLLRSRSLWMTSP